MVGSDSGSESNEAMSADDVGSGLLDENMFNSSLNFELPVL